MQSNLHIIEFITSWYQLGKPPISIFPFESSTTQLFTYLAVLISPLTNVIIEFKTSKPAGKNHFRLAIFIYFAFYMLLDAGMTIEHGNIDKLHQPLSAHYFTPLKAILFLAFLGSNARMVELTVRKLIHKKEKAANTIASLLFFSFLSIVSIGLLINFIRVEFYDNRQGDINVTREGDSFGSGQPVRETYRNNQGNVIVTDGDDTIDYGDPIPKEKPNVNPKQSKTRSKPNLHNEPQNRPRGKGALLVVFGSEYPCATSLPLYVDGIERGTVNLPGRLKIPLTEGVHKIAFGSSHDNVDEITISAGKTAITINPTIDCKPLHSTELTEILTKEELEHIGIR